MKEMFRVGRPPTLPCLGAKIALFRRPLIANGLFLPLPLSTSSPPSPPPSPASTLEVLFVKEKGKPAGSVNTGGVEWSGCSDRFPTSLEAPNASLLTSLIT